MARQKEGRHFRWKQLSPKRKGRKAQARKRLFWLVGISACKVAQKFRFYTLCNGEPLMMLEEGIFLRDIKLFLPRISSVRRLGGSTLLSCVESASLGFLHRLQVKLLIKLDVTANPPPE